jgi:hypothetical protein
MPKHATRSYIPFDPSFRIQHDRRAKRDLEFADELCSERNQADKRQWERERENQG